jgi:hypothetical protein
LDEFGSIVFILNTDTGFIATHRCISKSSLSAVREIVPLCGPRTNDGPNVSGESASSPKPQSDYWDQLSVGLSTRSAKKLKLCVPDSVGDGTKLTTPPLALSR